MIFRKICCQIILQKVVLAPDSGFKGPKKGRHGGKWRFDEKSIFRKICHQIILQKVVLAPDSGFKGPKKGRHGGKWRSDEKSFFRKMGMKCLVKPLSYPTGLYALRKVT